MTEGLIGLSAMLVIALLRIPIALSMGIVGFLGMAYMHEWSWPVATAMVQTQIYETGRNYSLSVIPLFILMGDLITRARMSQSLFEAAYAWVGHFRGGLAMSTVVASAGFGSVCGSSVATAATMARVAYPSMRRFKYSDGLAAGSIAAGGTLGILIPPSTLMVIYGIMTETSIGKLFAAGLLPGVLAVVLLCAAVAWVVRRDPSAGPPGERTGWKQRMVALCKIWDTAALFILVMGGIYGGVFTATEGAGIGSFGALVAALARKALGWTDLYDSLVDSARTTAMLFFILIGALMFAEFINYTTLPADVKQAVQRLGASPMMVLGAICGFYVLLGAAMEELSMIVLTLPVFFPLISALGIDPVWFGILIVVVVEIGLISPPVGMNLFVLNSLLPDVSQRRLFVGVMPFVAANIVRLALLIAFPAISLWIPSLMG